MRALTISDFIVNVIKEILGYNNLNEKDMLRKIFKKEVSKNY